MKRKYSKPLWILFALIGGMTGACDLLMTPPIRVEPSPPPLMGCEDSGRAAHCPPGPCVNTPVTGLSLIPFGCPGTGWNDSTVDDIDNAYASFYGNLQLVLAIETSNPGLITDEQLQYDSTVQTYDPTK